jgi:hypothetical protein
MIENKKQIYIYIHIYVQSANICKQWKSRIDHRSVKLKVELLYR